MNKPSQSDNSQQQTITYTYLLPKLRDAYQSAYDNGTEPRIEDFLVEVCEPDQPRLLRKLLLLELQLHRLAGRRVDIEDYRHRFPEHRAIIDGAFQLAAEPGDSFEQPTTGPLSQHDTKMEPESEGELPSHLDRYVIERELGSGSSAVVYLAYDPDLSRKVALKVPRKDRFHGKEDEVKFVEEARNAARLDHPGIVRVHDVCRDPLFIVQEYIAGQDLKIRLENRRYETSEAVELLIAVADAVGAAHAAGLYHRDLKPRNILLDDAGMPHVADFGLAVHVSRQQEHFGEVAGSYPYMAPEQTRGEVHRLDGRTDIWALGVILYELLTGKVPFAGRTRSELFEEIRHHDPRPPRQVDPRVSHELSRICLACLAKRAQERYDSTADLVDDLRHCLMTEQGGASTAPSADTPQSLIPQTTRIVPKGLRCFDAADAAFFLELLPGPRDREGLPSSIRFWKTRIEETSREQTFPVGLIYGPSGCGKSSLVKAGLLPRLAAKVLPVYVEATAADTETRLMKALQKHCPELPADGSLPQLFERLRGNGGSRGRKMLLVLDQFEQWLHANQITSDSPMVRALRHCDGGNLQCLLLVRDDFWMSITRFMQALEIPLLEGQNSAAVDLFDTDHARKVLAAFGRAYGRLADSLNDPTPEQERFLTRAVRGLAQDGNVVSVQVALFAEIMKGRPWTEASLLQVGGAEGVGVMFLEETFAARTAPPNHRRYAISIRAVLNGLLPEKGTDIKGQVRSYQQLWELSGCAARSADFDAVLNILDLETRLVTPTEPDETGGDTPPDAARTARHYQLTHDYLVPSLRRWLRQKDTESYAGRARLRLADRAALYHGKTEVKQLPSWWEYSNILAFTRKRDWTEPQGRMMAAARRYYLSHSVMLAIVVALLAWGGRDVVSRFRASALVNSLVKAGDDKILEVATDLRSYLPWAGESLHQFADADARTADERRQQLHARLALVATDETQVAPLLESLLAATPKHVGVIRDALRPYKDKVVNRLWTEFHAEQGAADRRFRAGMALAGYAPDSEQWTDDDFRFLSDQLLIENPRDQPEWLRYLEPVSSLCLPRFEEQFAQADATETQLLGAANALAKFLTNDQLRVAKLLTVANQGQYKILFPLIAAAPSTEASDLLRRITAESPPDDLSSVQRVQFGRRRAGAAITLMRLGERERVLPLFEFTDDPEAMTQFIHRCKDRGVLAQDLLELLEMASSQLSAQAKPSSDQVAGAELGEGIFARGSLASSASRPNRVRYALLLALSDYPLADVPDSKRRSLLDQLAGWYAHDPSSGVHGACGWLLRQWGENQIVRQIDQTPVAYSCNREWFTLAINVRPRAPDIKERESAADADAIADATAAESVAADGEKRALAELEEIDGQQSPLLDKFYLTFIVFPPGEYDIGSPEDEPNGSNYQRGHRVTITRPFAMLDRELTFHELIAFIPQYVEFMKERGTTPSHAAFGVDWYDAVSFCRWLTEEAGMSESDQAYADPESLDKEAYERDQNPEVNWAPKNWPLQLDRRGFRLPTEAEWEVAGRAGSRRVFTQGTDEGLVSHYGWFSGKAEFVRGPKTRRPGLRGQFDMFGNVFEWCHDFFGPYGEGSATDPTGPDKGSFRIFRGGSWSNNTAYAVVWHRRWGVPQYRMDVLGFRLAVVPSEEANRHESLAE